MNSEENKNTNSKSLLRAGFILSGIAIIIAAISLIFLDLYDNALFATILGNSSINTGDLAIVFILITIAMIFFLIVGVIVIRMANSFNYGKTTKLGIMILLMFIFIGIADFIMSSFYSNNNANGTISSTDQINGVLAIVGGVLVGSSLIIAVNKTKVAYLIAAILSLIGIPLIYFSIFYIPSSVISAATSNSGNFSSHTFLLNTVYSIAFPSHILFPTGFFMSYDYAGLIAGLLVPIIVIISYFGSFKENISHLLYYFVLLIFSLGELITGAILLVSSSINNFTNTGNPVYNYTISALLFSRQNSSGYIMLYSVFQYMAIIFAILALISGVLLLIYFAMNIVGVITPLKEMIEPQPTKTENKATKTGTPDIKEKLTVLKEQFDNGLITKEDYDMMKEELLNKL